MKRLILITLIGAAFGILFTFAMFGFNPLPTKIILAMAGVGAICLNLGYAHWRFYGQALPQLMQNLPALVKKNGQGRKSC
jgi:hypothetical protein